MATLLLVESSGPRCSVGLIRDRSLIALRESSQEFSHSESLANLTGELLKSCGLSPKEIDAISVSIGPGSYTGLRIGVSFAKGLAMAAGIPIIALDTLKILARTGLNEIDKKQSKSGKDLLLAPMIDARRMEVFTALYSSGMEQLRPSGPVILKPNYLEEFDDKYQLVIIGNELNKVRNCLSRKSILYIEGIFPNVQSMVDESLLKYEQSSFEDTPYLEPNYSKAFFRTS